MIDSTPGKRPQRVTLPGRYVTLTPLEAAAHGDALWETTRGAENDALWRYLLEGPFPERASFDASLAGMERSEDPLYFAIVEHGSGKAVGRAAYLRIEPRHRVIEVGSILFSPRLRQTRGATEAMYLMMRYAFEELGNRRYEWKCNALNEPSRRAALRLGFSFEGIFRQHMMVKGENRDTAWYSIIDREWPRAKAGFEAWLEPDNFSADGRQQRRLRIAGSFD